MAVSKRLGFVAQILELERGQCLCGCFPTDGATMSVSVDINKQPVTRELSICEDCRPWVDVALAEMDAEEAEVGEEGDPHHGRLEVLGCRSGWRICSKRSRIILNRCLTRRLSRSA
jgi:hypothetical protein